MLVVYPFFHTSGLKSGVLAGFIRGVTLIPHAVFEVRSVVDRIAEERITVLPGPPSILQSILNHPEFDSFALDSLRLSVTGAAFVPVELIARMKSDLRLDPYHRLRPDRDPWHGHHLRAVRHDRDHRHHCRPPS